MCFWKSTERLGAQLRMHTGEWWMGSALQRGKGFGEVLESFDGGKKVDRGQKNVAGSWSLSGQKWPREFFGIEIFILL